MPSVATRSPESQAASVLHWISCGPYSAAIAPRAGGSLASFFSTLPDGAGARDWLRPASQDALNHSDPLQMASFPLIPWANRLRDGRFALDGAQISMPPNMGNNPHTIHGLGWLLPWQVSEQSDEHIRLQLNFAGNADWPYAFLATQTFTLDSEGLHIAMTLTNTGSQRMPGDLGHHPYFPHHREGTGTRITAQVEAIWESDKDLLPRQLNPSHPAVTALRTGMALQDHVLDNNFSGFGGNALVEWPNGDRLQLQAETPLSYFVVYSPADQDVFCMEPVSNCTDWLNLRHASTDNHACDAGGHLLMPGQTLQAAFHLRPQPCSTAKPSPAEPFKKDVGKVTE